MIYLDNFRRVFFFYIILYHIWHLLRANLCAWTQSSYQWRWITARKYTLRIRPHCGMIAAVLLDPTYQWDCLISLQPRNYIHSIDAYSISCKWKLQGAPFANDNDNESNFIAMNYIIHSTQWYTGRTVWRKIEQTFLCIYISCDKTNKSIMYNPSLTKQFLYSWQRGKKPGLMGPNICYHEAGIQGVQKKNRIECQSAKKWFAL